MNSTFPRFALYLTAAFCLDAALLSPGVRSALAADIVYQGDTGILKNPSTVFGTNAANAPNSLFLETDASGNSVTVESGTVPGHVYGGIAAVTGMEASGNSVQVTGGTIGNTGSTPGGNVTGGWTYSGNATGNTVEIEGNATVRGIIYGGWIFSGSGGIIDSNTVTIDSPDATVRNNIYGGYSQGQSGEITKNTIEINGGRVTQNGALIAGGYSAILPNLVSGNSVVLNGGTITNANVYGGRGQSTSRITENTVSINGGTLSQGSVYGGQSMNGTAVVDLNSVAITGGTVNATIYGGQAGGNGTVTGNTVSISGGAITGDIYGGYSSRGTATRNTVTIGGTEALSTNSNLFGGYVNSGGGDAFTGNTLNKNRDTAVGSVRNFEYVNFGYAGKANIGSLDTTATGSAESGVILNTDANDVIFDGAIAGTGSLTKTGSGTLILTGNSSLTQNGKVQAQNGVLQLGDGGADGRLGSPGGFNVSAGAALAYKHSDDITETQRIAGDGKVIQRGSGALTLLSQPTPEGRNTFTGGTEIESGTLYMVDGFSLNRTNLAENFGTRAGYVIFTGTSGTKRVILQHDTDDAINLANSFRTQSGAGSGNALDLSSSPNAWLTGSNITDRGGAFYVADGTVMDVSTNALMLTDNRANGQLNDLYVEDGGTFNLYAGLATYFKSGIDGNGMLNISSAVPDTLVQFKNDSASVPLTFRMGTTNVNGSSNNMILNLARGSITAARVLFENSGSFNFSGNGSLATTVLAGDGIIRAGNEINITDGAALFPYTSDLLYSNAAPGTLTLQAPAINLNNFVLATYVNPVRDAAQDRLYTQIPLSSVDSQGIPFSNNNLLNLDSGTINKVSLGQGMVLLQTLDGTPFVPGDYLLIRSTNGFDGITDATGLSNKLIASVDGFLVDPRHAELRGGMSFRLGGDPDTDSGAMTPGTSNVWLANSINSLSMAWTGNAGAGEAAPASGVWESSPLFISLQTKDSAGETNFLTGDKVYVSGMNTFEIALPTSSDTSFGSKIVVSGLVVGRDMSGADTDGGLYTISDAGDADGGLVAYANTAVGKFVNSREADELVPTGKLQKYGNSTLIFTNTGGNLFSEGVELYGGTVAITRGDQLVVGPGRAITFKADATLQNNADLILDRDTAIVLEAGSATFRADNAFEMQGVISGTGSMIKAGTGTLTLSGENTYSGGMTVSGGILQIGNGGTAGSIVGDVNNNATLAFNRADDISYGKVISGTGSMIKDGPGALTLSGENTYTGGTAISAGTLQLGNGGTSGSITGNVSNNGRLVFRRSDVSSFDGIISGAGTVEQAGAGTTLLTAGNTHSGPTIVSAGTLQAGAVHTFSPASAMRVEPGALLDLNGFDQTVAGMVNAGMVRLKGAPGTVLTVRGDYTGINGTLAFNTVLGGDNSPSDKLVIDGGLGDDTSVLVTNIGGAGAKTTGNGILLVEAINGATTTNTAFSLGAPVLAGPYEYRLYRSGLDGGSPDNWFLRSSLDSVDDTPAFRQEASLYAAIPSLALSYGNLLLDSLDKRMGGQRVMDAEAQEDGARHLAWGRVIGLNGSRDGEGLGIHGDRGPDYDYHITALQAGTDLYRVKRADGSADNTGFYVAYGETKADVSHFGGGDAGDDRLYGLTLGAYWTHSGAAGWYLDGVLQGTWYDVEASGRLPEMDTRGFGLGLSLEGGYPIRFDNGLVLEPQAQLTYQSINLDDGHDMGAAIRFHDVESLNGRLGLRLSRSWALKAMGEDKPRQALAWGRASVLNEFLGRPETDFSSEEGFLPFRSDMHETSFRVDAGIDAEIARDVFLYASLQYQQKFGGDDHAIGGQVGLKVKL